MPTPRSHGHGLGVAQASAQLELAGLVVEDAVRRPDLVERGAGTSTGEVTAQLLHRPSSWRAAGSPNVPVACARREPSKVCANPIRHF
jgi:hypothetical protein